MSKPPTISPKNLSAALAEVFAITPSEVEQKLSQIAGQGSTWRSLLGEPPAPWRWVGKGTAKAWEHPGRSLHVVATLEGEDAVVSISRFDGCRVSARDIEAVRGAFLPGAPDEMLVVERRPGCTGLPIVFLRVGISVGAAA